MSADNPREHLLQVLYRLEEPLLQRNAWDDLRIQVDVLVTKAIASGISNDPAELLEAVRA